MSHVFLAVRTPAPFDAPKRFVAAGPYRFVRNPMYVGAIALLTGLAFVLEAASVLGLALAAAFLFEPLRELRRGALSRAPVRGDLRRLPAGDEPLDPAPRSRRLGGGHLVRGPLLQEVCGVSGCEENARRCVPPPRSLSQ